MLNFTSALLFVGLAVVGCAQTPNGGTRPYRMAFSHVPPRFTIEDVLKTIDLFSAHADGALDHRDIPWKDLLGGKSAHACIMDEVDELYGLYRKKNLSITTMMEPADGLNRQAESRQLIALGKSIADPAVQALYVDYVTEFAKMEHPAYLGLASETNVLLDFLKPDVVLGLKNMCAAAAKAVHKVSPETKVYVSVQAEYAWGKLIGSTAYRGTDAVFKSFPFMQALGVSSYPYFVWSKPADVPTNYFSRLGASHHLPVVVDEGGWTSAQAGMVKSDEATQAAWFPKFFELCRNSGAVFIGQLTYTDLDPSVYGSADNAMLKLFSHLGMVDTSWNPKPALQNWDKEFKKHLSH